MNQMVIFLHSETIQFFAERDLKVTRLSALISPYLAKLMKHNKLNATFLHEIVNMFSIIYVSEVTFVISSFNLIAELRELSPDAIIIPRLYKSP